MIFGRYVLPDLPAAHYQLWVRGYGLIDLQKVAADPGRLVDLSAAVAPDPASASQYYPAIYWFSLLKIPDKNSDLVWVVLLNEIDSPTLRSPQ